MNHRIVITGAPASGKTEVLDRLKSHPAFGDFRFFDELARQLLAEKPEYRQDWQQFHIDIFHRHIAREQRLGPRSFVTDRGTADAFGFHPETMQLVGTSLNQEYQRYTAVVQLGSSAALGADHYRRDDIRQENMTQALAIERAIRDIWRHHPGYHWLSATIDPEEKYAACVDLLTDLIGRTE